MDPSLRKRRSRFHFRFARVIYMGAASGPIANQACAICDLLDLGAAFASVTSVNNDIW